MLWPATQQLTIMLEGTAGIGVSWQQPTAQTTQLLLDLGSGQP